MSADHKSIWSKRQMYTLIRGLFILISGCLLVVATFYGTLAGKKLNSSLSRQMGIFEALRRNHAAGNELPSDLNGLARLELGSIEGVPEAAYYEQTHNALKYYQDGWGKSDRIVLQSSVCGMYVVTFGRGSQAVLQTWTYRDLWAENRNAEGQANHLQAGVGDSSWARGALVIVLVILLVIVLRARPRCRYENNQQKSSG